MVETKVVDQLVHGDVGCPAIHIGNGQWYCNAIVELNEKLDSIAGDLRELKTSFDTVRMVVYGTVGLVGAALITTVTMQIHQAFR